MGPAMCQATMKEPEQRFSSWFICSISTCIAHPLAEFSHCPCRKQYILLWLPPTRGSNCQIWNTRFSYPISGVWKSWSESHRLYELLALYTRVRQNLREQELQKACAINFSKGFYTHGCLGISTVAEPTTTVVGHSISNLVKLERILVL